MIACEYFGDKGIFRTKPATLKKIITARYDVAFKRLQKVSLNVNVSCFKDESHPC